MSRYVPIPIVGGSYADDSLPFTAQDTVGWIVRKAEGPGTRSDAKLATPPGLQEFATVGTRHRGAHNAEGKLFVVSGTGLYQILKTGAWTLLGTIPGNGRVSMAHNQVVNGNQVKIVNGSAGYIYNTATGVFAKITDSGYPGELVTEFIGSLFVGIEPQRRYFLNSAIADGLSYNTTETYQGEASPDRLMCLKPIHSELAVFSEGTIEFFDYTGITNSLFVNKKIVVEQGAASPYCVCDLDNTLFFVGSDGNGYRLNGYTPERITTHAIEQAWAHCDRSKCFAFTWEDRGHKVWYVTFPDGMTWGYDVATRLWHRRESYGLNRWRLAWLEKWNGAWYGGEYNTGRIFRLNWDYILEGRDPLVRERTLGVGHDNQNIMTLEVFEAVFDTGGPETIPGPVFPLRVDPTHTVPDGAVGDSYDVTYQAIGGEGPYTWAIADSLPAGLSFDGGHVTGTATTAEHDNAWTVQVTDSQGNSATLDDTAYIMDMTGTPPNAIQGEAYSFSFVGVEGTSPYAFSLASGALPAGLALSSAGAITGTPTDVELAEFTVTMTDDAGVTQTKPYSINISELVVEVTGSFGYCVDNYVSAWMNGTLFRTEVQTVNGSPVTIPADLMTPTGNKLVIKCRDTGTQTYAAFTLSVTGLTTTEILNANSTDWITKQVANTDMTDYSAGITGGTSGGQTPFSNTNSSTIAAANGWPTTRHGIWSPSNTHLWLEYDFDLP